MTRLLILLILTLSTQLIAIIMWGEYVWLYKFANGGVSGTPIGQVQFILWIIWFVELVSLFFVALYHKKNKGTSTE
ncbi:hypothetical protein [Sediminibacillus sp. JSM 1682029]|uniref:hypothetical protein n=1 Tax=Sediminibacillus sp. JSM 1682029 TaxID=3229857 RepID=UPI0035252A92